MYRAIKRLLFDFTIIEKRVRNDAIATVVYENSFKSNYFEWLNLVVPKEINIIKLKWRFKLLNPFKNLHLLDTYQKIFFHSPGEVMQSKLINEIRSSNSQVKIVGFQHGLIGETPPSSLEKVLRRAKCDFYISFEKSFTKFLQRNTKNGIFELLFDKPIMEKVSDYPLYFNCYFDAPDKKRILINARQLKRFLKKHNLKLTKIKFHPSTSWIYKIIIHLYLIKHLIFNNPNVLETAICWDSKVKYELARNNTTIYSFNNQNILCQLNFNHLKLDFGNHVRNMFIKSLEIDLNKEEVEEDTNMLCSIKYKNLSK
ncbi:MAG: hypothetical protein ACPGTO_03645 [Polaribacter sp.]